MYSNLKRAYTWGTAELQVRLMEGSGTHAYSFPPRPLLSQQGGSARAGPIGTRALPHRSTGATQLRVAEDAYAQCYYQWKWQSWQWVGKKVQWLHYLDVLVIFGAGLFLDKAAYTVETKEEISYPHFSDLPYDYTNVQKKQKRIRGKVKAEHAWKQTELWMCSLAHT